MTYYAPVRTNYDARNAVCEDCGESYDGAAVDGWALRHVRCYGHRVAVMRSYEIELEKDDAAA